MVTLHIKLKGMTQFDCIMVSNILPADTPLTPGMGSKHFISESSRFAYQIKGSNRAP